MNWLCWFGHKWGKWKCDYKNFMELRKRTCSRCGKTQVEEL